MLTTTIAVPEGTDINTVATRRLLHEAHIKRVHLARPLNITITPADKAIQTLSRALGLNEDAPLTYYKLTSETEPCPAT